MAGGVSRGVYYKSKHLPCSYVLKLGYDQVGCCTLEVDKHEKEGSLGKSKLSLVLFVFQSLPLPVSSLEDLCQRSKGDPFCQGFLCCISRPAYQTQVRKESFWGESHGPSHANNCLYNIETTLSLLSLNLLFYHVFCLEFPTLVIKDKFVAVKIFLLDSNRIVVST